MTSNTRYWHFSICNFGGSIAVRIGNRAYSAVGAEPKFYYVYSFKNQRGRYPEQNDWHRKVNFLPQRFIHRVQCSPCDWIVEYRNSFATCTKVLLTVCIMHASRNSCDRACISKFNTLRFHHKETHIRVIRCKKKSQQST